MTSSSEYESKKASFSESSLKDAIEGCHAGVRYSLVSKEINEKGIV